MINPHSPFQLTNEMHLSQLITPCSLTSFLRLTEVITVTEPSAHLSGNSSKVAKALTSLTYKQYKYFGSLDSRYSNFLGDLIQCHGFLNNIYVLTPSKCVYISSTDLSSKLHIHSSNHVLPISKLMYDSLNYQSQKEPLIFSHLTQACSTQSSPSHFTATPSFPTPPSQNPYSHFQHLLHKTRI